MKKVYIHYGSKEFDPARFKTPTNLCWSSNKPNGGLWASPVNAECGWKKWNDEEGDARVMDCDEANSFKFTLTEDAAVFYIRSYEDFKKLPMRRLNEFEKSCPDFQQCISIGIDAIEVEWFSDHFDIRDPLWDAIYGWDCDSIIVLNPDIIVPEVIMFDKERYREAFVKMSEFLRIINEGSGQSWWIPPGYDKFFSCDMGYIYDFWCTLDAYFNDDLTGGKPIDRLMEVERARAYIEKYHEKKIVNKTRTIVER